MFLNRMVVSEIAIVDSTTYWQTDDNFYVAIFDGNQAIELIIPAYFISDFCSTPKIPFAYLLYGGIGNKAGLTHDALYSDWTAIKACNLHTREPLVITREWADNVLYAALITCNVPSWKARMMYLAVKLFGGRYFQKKSLFEQGVFHE